MLRALKKSFTCTARQRKASRSRQNSILLHMTECASSEKDFKIKDTERDSPATPKSGDSRRSRRNSVSVIGRNNSMNDWQEIVTALKSVDRGHHNSTEASEAIESERVMASPSEEAVKLASEEVPSDPTSSDSAHLLSNNVASRLTPSATPLLHRKNSFDAAKVDKECSGERFISEYNVRLEPVIKICIPCQHDHSQFHTPNPNTRMTSSCGAVAIDDDVNSNSATALTMRSVNMAPARVEVAVDAPDPDIAVTVVNAETAAGDESSQHLALEAPPPKPESPKPATPSPTQDKGTNSSPQRFDDDQPHPASSNQPSALVEVAEWTGDDALLAMEITEPKKEEEATERKDEEENELIEPASASEVITSRQEALSSKECDTNSPIDAVMPPPMEQVEADSEAAKQSASEKVEDEKASEKGERARPEIEEADKEKTLEKEEEDSLTIETDSRVMESEREASPTDVSLASFVDVYDKEPLHPTDDESKTTINLMQRASSQESRPEPSSEQDSTSEVRPAPWLGSTEPTTSAFRWQRMKEMVKEREASGSLIGKIDEKLTRGEHTSEHHQKILKSLMLGVRQASSSDDPSNMPINDELRDILASLRTQNVAQQRREPKSVSPQEPPSSVKPAAAEVKQRVIEKEVIPPRKNVPKRVASVAPVDEGKRRDYSFSIELDAADAVVCSFLRPADRRVVAAAAKNNCSVSVTPMEEHRLTRKFMCVVSGPTRDQVARCINFLKDTFPKSYIRYNR